MPQNGWFILGDLFKMDDLGVVPILGNLHVCTVSVCVFVLRPLAKSPETNASHRGPRCAPYNRESPALSHQDHQGKQRKCVILHGQPKGESQSTFTDD